MDIRKSEETEMIEGFLTPFYCDWRRTRIQAILNYYTPEYFKGRAVLELGAGRGDIGAFFYYLGADVTAVEGRQGNCECMADTYPFLDARCLDLNQEFPDGHYDLILHTGVLYHLDQPEANLRWCLDHCQHMVLETEVADSVLESKVVLVEESTGMNDQALNGVGCRPTELWIEETLSSCGFYFEKCCDPALDTRYHIYSWENRNDLSCIEGNRRLWFCQKG